MSGQDNIILQLRNLSLTDIYSNINAIACRGEVISLIGANGIGKSTLLRSIASLNKNFSGEIIMNRSTLTDISYVPSQMGKATNLSVFDMLSLSCYHRSNWLGIISLEDKERIFNALELVGLKGYENRDSSKLSDGEYQRATIAGSLVRDSQLIILDEPTSFLDIANKYLITDLIRKIATESQKTVIFSTHDLQQAVRISDRIWIMGYDSFYDETPQSHAQRGNFDKVFDLDGLRFDPVTLSYTISR